MALGGWHVERVPRSACECVIARHHYSGGLNGVKSTYCFGLYRPDGLMAGAAVWGETSTTSWAAYGAREHDVLELRRLACIDDTPRNAESFLIGRCIRWIRDNTEVALLVTYADPAHGHSGGIYKATNWEYAGETPSGVVICHEGKAYHDRSLRVRHGKSLKPFAASLADALARGDAERRKVPGKHRFIMRLRRP